MAALISFVGPARWGGWLVGIVVLFGWDAASDATGWIRDISFAPRNQVNMRVSNRLSRILAAIHADIESGHCGVLGLNRLLAILKQLINGIAFRLMEVQVIGDVSSRDDERVERRDGILVGYCHRELPLDEDSGWDVTEAARFLPMVVALSHIAEICVVAISLGGVVRVAQRLQVRQVV